jgi:hypothetical protein
MGLTSQFSILDSIDFEFGIAHAALEAMRMIDFSILDFDEA